MRDASGRGRRAPPASPGRSSPCLGEVPVPGQPLLERLVLAARPAQALQRGEVADEVLRQPRRGPRRGTPRTSDRSICRLTYQALVWLARSIDEPRPGRQPTIPQDRARGPRPAADQFADHAALVTTDDGADLRRAARRVRRRRRGYDRPGPRARRPRRDLGAEHLALGGRLPGRAPTPAACSCRSTPATPPRGRRHRRPHRRAAAGRADGFLGRTQVADLDRDSLPRPAALVRVPIDWTTARWDEFVGRGEQPKLSATSTTARPTRSPRRRRRHPVHLRHHRAQQGRDERAPADRRRGPAAWAECGGVTSDDRYLVVNPFFHSFGYKAGIVVGLLTGATLYPDATFDLEETMRADRGPADHRAARRRRRSTSRCSTTRSAATTTCRRCGSRSPARPSCPWC